MKLLKILFIWLMICTALRAQEAALNPYLVDGFQSDTNGTTSGFVAFPEGVTAGDLITTCETWGASLGTGLRTPTDSQGNTYTGLTPQAVGTSVVQQFSYTIAGTTGPDTVQYVVPGGVGMQMVVAHFKNLSGTLDGSPVVTAQTNSGVAVITNSVTSTNNGDMAVSCSSPANSGDGIWAGDNAEYITHDSTSTIVTMTNTFLGPKGTYSISHNGNTVGGAWVLESVLFKPAAFAVATTKLFDCAVGVFCQQSLSAVGGTGTFSWGITSGSCPGMGLTGSKYSGTPTTAGGCTITFQVNDGTNTASKTLSFRVWPAFGTPTVNSSQHFNADLIGSISVPVTCGDYILLQVRGGDTHGSEGFVLPFNGVNNYFKDSFGSPIKRILSPIPGLQAFPVVTLLLGPVNQTGTDVVTWNDNVGVSLGRSYNLAAAISNIQDVFDVPTYANLQLSGNTAYSVSTTTVVPNTLLVATGTTDRGNATGLTLGSFTTMQSGIDVQGIATFGYLLQGAAGSATAAFTPSGGTGTANWSTLMFGLRPAPPAAACGTTRIYHRTDLK